jgi:hypothetical protein
VSENQEFPSELKIGDKVFHFPWIRFVPRPGEDAERDIESAIKENGV